MILDFETMNVTEIPHFYGGEKSILARLSNDGLNKIMVGRVVPGASIGVHTHETSSEIVYVISGSGKAVYDGGTDVLTPGVCHYCPKGHSHGIYNDGTEDLVVFAVVPEQ